MNSRDLQVLQGGRKELRHATVRPVRSFHSLKVQSLYVVKLKLSLRIRLASSPYAIHMRTYVVMPAKLARSAYLHRRLKRGEFSVTETLRGNV